MTVAEGSGGAAAPEIQSARGTEPLARPRIADQVVLDLELPHLDVQAAIRSADETVIWRAYRAAHDQEVWLDGLVASVGSHVFERQHSRDPSRTTPWQHVLIAWPLLLPAPSYASQRGGEDDVAVSRGLLDELHKWLQYRHEARLLAGVTSYEEVCRWSPLNQRRCLQLLARETPEWGAPLRPDAARLPSGFPRLAFVIGSIAEWIVQPQLPGAGDSPQRNWELQLETTARIGYVLRCSVPAEHVGVPSCFAAAVRDGLQRWLRALLQLGLVRSWRVNVGHNDLVVLELAGNCEGAPLAQVPLRMHQITIDGFRELVGELQDRLGPAMDAGLCQA